MFNKTQDARSVEIEEVITEYIENSFKAGSSSDHLLEHLQSLYDTEKLIKSPIMLDKVRKLSICKDPHHYKPLRSDSVLSPHSPSSTKSEVALSKHNVYHSSILCCALTTNQELPSLSPNLHFLREMSISQSPSGKYLIAVNDRTTFIAFQSELDLRKWTEKYESFDKGTYQSNM